MDRIFFPCPDGRKKVSTASRISRIRPLMSSFQIMKTMRLNEAKHSVAEGDGTFAAPSGRRKQFFYPSSKSC
jgi:hypothetical protein